MYGFRRDIAFPVKCSFMLVTAGTPDLYFGYEYIFVN